MSGFSRVKVPVETRASVSSVHSSSDPVHQWMRAGLVIAATSLTKSRIPWCVVGAALAPEAVSLVVLLAFCVAVMRWSSGSFAVRGSRGIVVGDSVVPLDRDGTVGPGPGAPDATAGFGPFILDRSTPMTRVTLALPAQSG